MAWQSLLNSSFPAKEVAEISGATSTKLLVSVDSLDGAAGDYGYIVPTFFNADIGAFEGVWKKVFWGKFQQIDVDSLEEQQFGLLFFPSRIKGNYLLRIYEYQRTPNKNFVANVSEPTLLLQSNPFRSGAYIVNFGGALRISGNPSFSGSEIEELLLPSSVWFHNTYKGEIWVASLSEVTTIEAWEMN